MCPQESVVKVKSSSGKIARSTMSLVSSSLEANDFYREKLFRYLREMPMIKEWAPKMQAHELTLASFEVTSKCMRDLGLITKELHFILEALRPKLSEPLQALVKAKATMVVTQCIAGSVREDSAEIAGQAQQVLQELSILWPLDGELQTLTMELAGHMQNINLASQQQRVGSLMTELHGLLSGEEVHLDAIMSAISKVQAACACIKSSTAEQKEQSKSVLEAWLCLMEFAAGEGRSFPGWQAGKADHGCLQTGGEGHGSGGPSRSFNDDEPGPCH